MGCWPYRRPFCWKSDGIHFGLNSPHTSVVVSRGALSLAISCSRFLLRCRYGKLTSTIHPIAIIAAVHLCREWMWYIYNPPRTLPQNMTSPRNRCGKTMVGASNGRCAHRKDDAGRNRNTANIPIPRNSNWYPRSAVHFRPHVARLTAVRIPTAIRVHPIE